MNDDDLDLPAGAEERGDAPPADAGHSAPQDDPSGESASSRAGGPTGDAGQHQTRLREAVQYSRRLERQVQRLQQQLDRPPAPERRAEPTAPEDPETVKIREQLFSVLPQLKGLVNLDPEQLRSVVSELAPSYRALEGNYWQRQGALTLREIAKRVTSEYGEGDVDPEAVQFYQAGFLDYLQRDQDAKERYLAGDPDLVDEYWEKVTSRVVNPIRQRAKAPAVERAGRVKGLPPFSGRGTPPRPRPPARKSGDELHDQAFDALADRLSGAD